MDPLDILLPMLVAQAEPAAVDPGELIRGIGSAVANKHWNVAIGFILALLIMVADWFNVLKWVPAGQKRWAAAAIAFVIAISGGLMAGTPIANILGAAVTMACAAVGSYELILKRFDEPPPKPPEDDGAQPRGPAS